MFGLFFYLSGKYEVLGVQSIYGQIKSLGNSQKGDNEEAKKEPKFVAKVKKKFVSATNDPANFEPWQEVSTRKGDFDSFAKRMRNSSSIVLVAGKRGSGKSVLGFRLMENIHAKAKRPAYVLGVKQSVLPSWIDSVENLEEVGNGGVVLVDEGAISFGSRNSMSKQNKELGALLAVARHKDLTLILITQNTGMIDKNVLNLCDTVLIKEGSLLQQKMERSVMKDLYKAASESITHLPAEDRQKHVYVFDNDFEGLCKVPLPSFWTSKISKNQA